MLAQKKLAVFTATMFCIGLLSGCSENSQTTQSAANLLDNVNSAAVESDLAQMGAAGVDLSSAKGVFSIGWHEILKPMSENSTIEGRALAIGFNGSQQQDPRFLRRGVDMGSVYLNYGNKHVELQKRTGPRGGVSYSSFSDPREGGPITNIDFVGGGVYEFEVTGSDKFSAIKTSVTAPPALLNIASHSNNEAINPANDLHLTWEGGMANDKIVIHIGPQMLPPPGGIGPPPPGGMGPGGRHRGDVGPHPGDHPRPPDSSKAIVVRLDSNTGSYTVSAAQLQQLLSGANTTNIIVGISQIRVSEVDHDGGKIHVVMNNGDRVLLRVQ